MNDKQPTYRKFSFSRREIIWALRNLDLLKSGYWPIDSETTGYIDMAIGTKTVRREPGSVKPVLIAGEIEARLERCGVDGYMVKGMYCLNDTPETIGRHFGLSGTAVTFRVQAVLRFVSGWRRKLSRYDRHSRAYYGIKKGD